jgi:hypothetical protein
MVLGIMIAMLAVALYLGIDQIFSVGWAGGAANTVADAVTFTGEQASQASFSLAPCGVCGPRGPWMAPVGEIPTCPTCSVERDRILEAGGEPDIPTAASVEFVTAAASSRPT